MMAPLRVPIHYMEYAEEDAAVLDLSRRPLEKIEEKPHHVSYSTMDHRVPRQLSPRSVDDMNYDSYSGSSEPSPRHSYQNNASPSGYYQTMQMYPRSPASDSPPASYLGTDHLNQYAAQTAFHHQQMMLQRIPSRPGNSEADAASESGSDGHPTIAYNAGGKDVKIPRPFKAYPKDPLSLATGFAAMSQALDQESLNRFETFRESMLRQICQANGGQATVSNPKMRRTVNNNNNNNTNTSPRMGSRDTTYTEKRKKNNEAAKKSRDRRRIKEDEIAIRASFLERENYELKVQLTTLKQQLASLDLKPTKG